MAGKVVGVAGGALGLRRLPEVNAACLAWPPRDGEAGSGGFSARYGRKRRQPSTVRCCGTLAILSHQLRRGRGDIVALVKEGSLLAPRDQTRGRKHLMRERKHLMMQKARVFTA